MIQIDYNRKVMQALANETVEYGKKNPSIEPLLRSVGLNAAAGAPAPASAKPATK